jgi:hypothetical protein
MYHFNGLNYRHYHCISRCNSYILYAPGLNIGIEPLASVVVRDDDVLVRDIVMIMRGLAAAVDAVGKCLTRF